MSEKLFGFLPINKPKGITSRRAVDAVKKLVKPAKVGHTGTLDPMAEGVLLICIGPATRLASFVQQSQKSYLGSFRLGVISETDDVEAELTVLDDAPRIESNQLESVLHEFAGVINQVPPQYSAIKVNGQRAYKLARSGKTVELKPREVNVYDLRLAEFEYPNFKLNIECGAGTYVRSIGRDIGKHFGSGAVMTALTRTTVGMFSLSQCVDVESLTLEVIRRHLVSPASIFEDLPETKLGLGQVTRLANGGVFTAAELELEAGLKRVVALDESGNLIALLQSGKTTDQYRIEYNFANHYTDRS